MEWLTLKQLSERIGLSEQEIEKQFDRAPEIKMAKHDKAYDQVAHPSAGGTTPAGKHSDCATDALGNPGRYSKQTEFDAKETGGVKEARDKQLGDNGMAGN